MKVDNYYIFSFILASFFRKEKSSTNSSIQKHKYIMELANKKHDSAFKIYRNKVESLKMALNAHLKSIL